MSSAGLALALLSAPQAHAACQPLSSTFHLVNTASAGISPAGATLVTVGTGASGFTPTLSILPAPSYWYSAPISGDYDAGIYDLKLWSNGGAGPANVTFELGTCNPDGSGYVSVGSVTRDLWAAGGNHITELPLMLPAISLNNQVLRITLVLTGGSSPTIVYNGGTDFDSRLSTPGGVGAGCPTYTPTPCGYTQLSVANGASEKVLYLSSLSAGEPAGWDSVTGFIDSSWANSMAWAGDSGHGRINPFQPWSSYVANAASNGNDKLLVRRAFNIPAGATAISGSLELAVDDNSDTLVNGVSIQSDATGAITNQVIRSYPLAPGTLVPGSNLLAVRLRSPLASLVAYTFILHVEYIVPCESPTDTPTVSATPSATPSATATPSFSATPSATPSATETPSSTATPSATPSASATPSFTDSPTRSSTPTFSATPSPSFSPSDSPTSTVTWTFSATPTLTATPSSSSTATATPSFSSTRTVTSTFSISPTFTASPSFTQTPVPAPFSLTVGVYNSAGERVRVIFSGSCESLPRELGLSARAVATDSTGLHLAIPGWFHEEATGLRFSGGLDWDLRNDSGQGVAGGVYLIKAEFHDPFNQVTSLSEPVQLIASEALNSLAIFNSAGELVRHRLLGGALPAIVDIATDSPRFAPQYDSSGVNVAGDLILKAKDKDGVTHPLAWDGKNDQGIPVESGVYLLQLIYRASGAAPVVVQRSVTVIKSLDGVSLRDAVLGPNPLTPGRENALLLYSPTAGCPLSVRIFSLGGERVAEFKDSGQDGRLELGLGKLAGGVYLVRVEKLSGGSVRASRVLKLAILK